MLAKHCCRALCANRPRAHQAPLVCRRRVRVAEPGNPAHGAALFCLALRTHPTAMLAPRRLREGRRMTNSGMLCLCRSTWRGATSTPGCTRKMRRARGYSRGTDGAAWWPWTWHAACTSYTGGPPAAHAHVPCAGLDVVLSAMHLAHLSTDLPAQALARAASTSRISTVRLLYGWHACVRLCPCAPCAVREPEHKFALG